MQRVTIRIKGAKQTLSTEGFVGDECLTTTDGIRKRLSGLVESEQSTAERFEDPVREVAGEFV